MAEKIKSLKEEIDEAAERERQREVRARKKWEDDANVWGGWSDAYPSLIIYPIGPSQVNKYDPYSLKASLDDEIIDVR